MSEYTLYGAQISYFTGKVHRRLATSERERADLLIDSVGGQAPRSFDAVPRLDRAGLSVALSRESAG